MNVARPGVNAVLPVLALGVSLAGSAALLGIGLVSRITHVGVLRDGHRATLPAAELSVRPAQHAAA